MKPEWAASFVAAVLCHGLLLFGFRMDTPAHPLAMSDEPAPVDVSLVEAPPAPPEPASTPEPPEPQSTPEMPAPEPSPTPEAMPAPESTPAPQRPHPSPRHRERRHSSTPHAAAGASAAPAGAASRGATGGPGNSRASYLSNPKPDYPEEARQQHQQGVVLVNIVVGADGRASEVTLGRSSGFPLLDQAALQAVRRWRFDPARAAGLPVSSPVQVPIRFSLSE